MTMTLPKTKIKVGDIEITRDTTLTSSNIKAFAELFRQSIDNALEYRPHTGISELSSEYYRYPRVGEAFSRDELMAMTPPVTIASLTAHRLPPHTPPVWPLSFCRWSLR